MSDLVLYTTAEVAEILRMNPQVIMRKLAAGEIPAYRIGREWRVERSALLEWLERHSNRRPDAREPEVAFFDEAGRLRSIPAKRSRRLAVYERIVAAFERDRSYQERELNEVLRRFHDDVATLRRELVTERLLVRTRDGVYKRSASREPALRRG